MSVTTTKRRDTRARKGAKRDLKGRSVSQLAASLLHWYDASKREMPWRGTRDPYAIWVSEIMLQQTQVATVVPYYRRFMRRFPTLAALARAELSQVLALWSGLGYYRRAKHLHAGARKVVTDLGGQMPATVEGLRALPGIGRYTAGAIASIAFGVAAPVVDGNVMRVLARLHGYDKDIAVPANQAFFWERATELVQAPPDRGDRGSQEKRHGDVNQAVMELGATVCVPTSPKCGACPLRDACVARREGRQAELPVKGAKKAAPVVRLRALVILRQRAGREEVLLMQRPAGGLWEHMWEFPTLEARRAPSLPGVTLQDVRECGQVRHQLTHRTMVYDIVMARITGRWPGGGIPGGMPCDGGTAYAATRWVAWPLEVGSTLPKAKVVEKIAQVAARFGIMHAE